MEKIPIRIGQLVSVRRSDLEIHEKMADFRVAQAVDQLEDLKMEGGIRERPTVSTLRILQPLKSWKTARMVMSGWSRMERHGMIPSGSLEGASDSLS